MQLQGKTLGTSSFRGGKARLAQLVEHHLDTVGVTGSSPVPRTISYGFLVVGVGPVEGGAEGAENKESNEAARGSINV